jgi:hypothetical protein
MVDLTDAELDAALLRGKQLAEREPRARQARYNRETGQIVIDLTNGCQFSVPVELIQGLATATEAQIQEIELLGEGFGLRWEALDLDMTVPGLLAGVFGTRAWMARRAGQAKSPAKSAAARANGARGGRPRKVV